MAGNRGRDTKPEIALRKALHARGLRYRVDVAAERDVRSRPDVVFRRSRVAVFVDGCFWHGCPEHGTMPAANRDYWAAKLARNAERDARVDALLAARGWTVVRVWEHEEPDEAARRIESAGREAQSRAAATSGGSTPASTRSTSRRDRSPAPQRSTSRSARAR